MLIKAVPEDYLQNDDDVSCVTVVTVITGPSFISQDRRIYLPTLFQHTVEEAATEYNKKGLVAALSHLQYFMHASNHETINWEDLIHDHMTQDFWGAFATYMGKYESNNTKFKFADGKSSFSRKSAKILKKTKTASFLNNLSQSCASSKTYIFLETFGPSEINRKNANSSKTKVSF